MGRPRFVEREWIDRAMQRDIWPEPRKARDHQIVDGDGETFLFFHPQRNSAWRNSPFGLLQHDGIDENWRHHGALFKALPALWDAAIDAVKGVMPPASAAQYMASLLGAALPGVEPSRWPRVLACAQSPWTAQDGGVYGRLGLPVASVSSLARRHFNVHERLNRPEIDARTHAMAQTVARMPEVLRAVGAIVAPDASDQTVLANCQRMLDVLRACAEHTPQEAALPLAA